MIVTVIIESSLLLIWIVKDSPAVQVQVTVVLLAYNDPLKCLGLECLFLLQVIKIIMADLEKVILKVSVNRY